VACTRVRHHWSSKLCFTNRLLLCYNTITWSYSNVRRVRILGDFSAGPALKFLYTKFYATSTGRYWNSGVECGRLSSSEVSSERSAGVWVALVIYLLGGAYLLAFWVLDQTAYYLILFGVVSLLTGFALFQVSRWAWWLGLFSFPIFFVEVAYALLSAVNFVGWYPDLTTGVFHASMIIYLVFLCFAFLLLIDRRNVLKSDHILDSLSRPVSKSATSPKDQQKKV